MHLTPIGPLSTGSLLWRTRQGAFALTVVCKATYKLAPGRSPLSAQQDPVREQDAYAGVDPHRWLWAPADLVPYKMRADVVLVGHAFAPGGQPARKLRARLTTTGIDKTIEVHCGRRLGRDGRMIEGSPAAQLALGWDRAVYAPGNPCGVMVGRPPDAFGLVSLPSVAWPEDVATSASTPAGFGPIAPWWPGRVEKLGRFRLGALASTWNGAALPDDADNALFQVAPPDQQPAALDAEPWLSLENLHPATPRLETRLGGVKPRAHVQRLGRAPEPLALVADTLWIDTDRGVCTVTWRGWMLLAHAEEAGTVTLWTDGGEPPSNPATSTPPVQAQAPSTSTLPVPVRFDPRETAAMDPALHAKGSLPFAAAPAGAPSAFMPPPSAAPARRAFDPRETSAVDPAVAMASLGRFPFKAQADTASAQSAPASFERRAPAESAPFLEIARPAETPAVPETAALSTERAPFDVAPPAWLGPPPEEAPAQAAAPETPPPPPPLLGAVMELAAPAAKAEGSPADRRAELDRRWSARESLDGMDLSGMSLAGVQLDGASLVKASFERSDLSRASLRGATLTGANLTGANLSAAILDRAILEKGIFVEADLRGASLVDAGCDGADFHKAQLGKASLRGARCGGASFEDADAPGVRLTEALAASANLRNANLEGAQLRGATLVRSCLAGANLKRAIADGADLTGADLSRADLSRGSLRDATLEGALLTDAILESADLRGADLTRADGTGAKLSGAKLDGAKRDGAKGL
jgi:uncharacterized protein YjbI with pentapeptide repeats